MAILVEWFKGDIDNSELRTLPRAFTENSYRVDVSNVWKTYAPGSENRERLRMVKFQFDFF